MHDAADPTTIAARRVLIDALDALAEHHSSLVLVGAQAVYLRTQEIRLSFAASYTTDGDLVVDPRHLADAPDLETVMRTAAFELVAVSRPGIWGKQVQVAGRTETITVDLIVPEALGGPGTRGARLDAHGRQAATRAVGLEAALIDHGPLTIAALDPTDIRQFTVNVAGPTALLVAKLHKVRERVDDQTSRPHRVRGKDSADIYRLMQNLDATIAATMLRDLLVDDTAGNVTRDALGHLNHLFAARRSPGVQLAITALAGDIPADRVVAVCTRFTKTVLEQLNALE